MKLNASQMAIAVKSNPVYGQKVGWQSRYIEVLKLLGFPSTCPTDEVFAQSVADWQANRFPPLTPDGMIGPNTWSKMEPELRKAPGAPPPPEPPPSGAGPLWFQYAQTEANRWAAMRASWGSDKDPSKAEEYLDWDEKYFCASPFYGGISHADGTYPDNKNLDWCAAFVNWCLHRAGFSHTGSASAGSFLKSQYWRFDALKEPRLGCVLVFNNGTHVTFYKHWSGSAPHNPNGDVIVPGTQGITVLGGNQSNRVREKAYSQIKLTAARGRNGVTSPYLWPLQGEATCNIRSVPTANGHFCGLLPN